MERDEVNQVISQYTKELSEDFAKVETQQPPVSSICVSVSSIDISLIHASSSIYLAVLLSVAKTFTWKMEGDCAATKSHCHLGYRP